MLKPRAMDFVVKEHWLWEDSPGRPERRTYRPPEYERRVTMLVYGTYFSPERSTQTSERADTG